MGGGAPERGPRRDRCGQRRLHRGLEYGKLQIAFDALWRREHTRFAATNPDPYCPTPEGGEPDAAAIIAALEACTGRRCEPHFGKPGRPMMDTAVHRLGLPADRGVIVGDRLYTDIAAADTVGMLGALVLTGETSLGALESLGADGRPDYVLARIDHVFPASEWERGWPEEA